MAADFQDLAFRTGNEVRTEERAPVGGKGELSLFNLQHTVSDTNVGLDRACLCGFKREARDAIYTPQRLGRSHEMGQA